MKYSDYKKVLKLHSLRITDCRIDVLELFYNNNHALSMKDLESYLEDYDKVTLYRTINSFVEKGVLHRIPDKSGLARFGLCTEVCTPEKHHHDHVHFKCNICGHTNCLSDFQVPIVDLPGYDISDSTLIINGICRQCKLKEANIL